MYHDPLFLVIIVFYASWYSITNKISNWSLHKRFYHTCAFFLSWVKVVRASDIALLNCKYGLKHRADSWILRTGHFVCGHYVVMSCTLGCFHSYPRLKLTFTIIVLSKYFNIRYGLWCVYIWCSFRHVWTQKGAYSDPSRNVSNRNPHGSHAKLCYLHYCQAS